MMLAAVTLSPFSTRRLFSREATFSFVGVAYHISKCDDADKGKSRFARKKSPSGKRALVSPPHVTSARHIGDHIRLMLPRCATITADNVCGRGSENARGKLTANITAKGAGCNSKFFFKWSKFRSKVTKRQTLQYRFLAKYHTYR